MKSKKYPRLRERERERGVEKKRKKQIQSRNSQKCILSLYGINNRHNGKIAIGIISPVYLPAASGTAGAAGESRVGMRLGGAGTGCGGGAVAVEAGYWGVVRGLEVGV